MFAAQQQKLISNQGGSLDGSTVAAAATRHRLLTLDHVEKRIGLLDQVMAQNPNSQPWMDTPYWMGNTPSGRLLQKQRYLKARRALEKRHAANELKIPSKRKSLDKIRVSVADPEAPLGLESTRFTDHFTTCSYFETWARLLFSATTLTLDPAITERWCRCLIERLG